MALVAGQVGQHVEVVGPVGAAEQVHAHGDEGRPAEPGGELLDQLGHGSLEVAGRRRGTRP